MAKHQIPLFTLRSIDRSWDCQGWGELLPYLSFRNPCIASSVGCSTQGLYAAELLEVWVLATLSNSRGIKQPFFFSSVFWNLAENTLLLSRLSGTLGAAVGLLGALISPIK